MAIKGYWRLNGNSNDASGNGNNGTGTGITYSQADGRLNQGAGFDAVGDKILIANEANFDFERTQPFTISCWFKLNTNNSDRPLVSKQVASSNYTGIHLWYNSDGSTTWRVRFDLVCTPSNYASIFVNITPSVGKWYNIIATSSGNSNASGLNIYINGKRENSTVISNNLTSSILNNVNVEIGNRNGAYNFNGSMDEVIIDNTEWKPAQVKNEYARTKGFF